MSIKVGDEVLFGRYLGVVRFKDADDLYVVEFGDDFRGGHTCEGKIQSGKGWWCTNSELLVERAVVKTKQELIIDKIKYLDKKFEERNKNEFPF